MWAVFKTLRSLSSLSAARLIGIPIMDSDDPNILVSIITKLNINQPSLTSYLQLYPHTDTHISVYCAG